MRKRAPIFGFVLALAGLVLAGGSLAQAATPPLSFVRCEISGGNGNGQVDRHECNSLFVVLRNTSGQTNEDMEARLLTTTPGVEVASAEALFPDFAIGQSQTNTTPFTISTSPDFKCGTTIQFVLLLFDEDVSLGEIPFTLTTPTSCVDGGGTCPSTFTLQGVIHANDPRQYGRLARTGRNATCGTALSCPGLANEIPPLAHRYDHWVLENQDDQVNCVTIEFVTDCDLGEAPLFCVVYRDFFNPADLCQNYLADVGASPQNYEPVTFSFSMLPHSRAVVVVHEVQTETDCDSYRLNVMTQSGFVSYQPEIKFQFEAPSMLVLWPTNAWRYGLESSQTLSPPAFSPVTNTPGIMDEFFVSTNAVTKPSGYFRLRQLYH